MKSFMLDEIEIYSHNDLCNVRLWRSRKSWFMAFRTLMKTKTIAPFQP
jgi:hypothetical protein